MLHLASASPRRREILEALGLRFSYAGTDVDETALPEESAANMVLRLARLKAEAAQDGRADHAILAADTAVVLGDRIFGKPASMRDGLAMLTALSGRTHEVLTGVVLLDAGQARQTLSRSRVTFRLITEAEARGYWNSGEPRDKAGGYAIQGLAAIFVRELQGSHSGVVGLPIFETAELLGNIGIHLIPQA